MKIAENLHYGHTGCVEILFCQPGSGLGFRFALRGSRLRDSCQRGMLCSHCAQPQRRGQYGQNPTGLMDAHRLATASSSLRT